MTGKVLQVQKKGKNLQSHGCNISQISCFYILKLYFHTYTAGCTPINFEFDRYLLRFVHYQCRQQPPLVDTADRNQEKMRFSLVETQVNRKNVQTSRYSNYLHFAFLYILNSFLLLFGDSMPLRDSIEKLRTGPQSQSTDVDPTFEPQFRFLINLHALRKRNENLH